MTESRHLEIGGSGVESAGKRDAATGPRPMPSIDPTFASLGGPDPLLQLQRAAGNRAVGRLLGRAARGTSLSSAPSPVQRQNDGAGGPPAGSAAPSGTTAPAPEGLIVEDAVTDLRPEQMRRGDFVAQARSAAAQGVSDGAGPLAGQGQDELQSTAARYQSQQAAQLEATVRSEVEGAAAATSATGMIAAIRESSSIEARARISSGISDDAVESAKDMLNNASQAFSAVTGLLFKARDDASPVAAPSDVAEAQARLGGGEGVPSGLRTEVEKATGTDLSAVRVHRDGPGAAMADGLGARAFTVGQDIVVAGDQPGPGTLHGDALLAHELAHAAQQSGGRTETAEKSDSRDDGADEAVADDLAVEAVLGLRTGIRGRLATMGAEAARRIKSGLRLQRCGRAKIDPTKEELNKKVLEKMAEANVKTGADSGVHYPYQYEHRFPVDWAKLGRPKDGYANPAYWDRKAFMHWVRKPGVSASAAMDAFFAGPTIADCASVATASQIAALRAALGDTRFDKAFGGKGTKPREKNGVRISLEIGQGIGSSVLADLMRETESVKDAGQPGHRKVQPGELHYFKNHPKYPVRHPTGYWQGENALYMGETGGKQMWSGFGATWPEAGMDAELVKHYNHEPSPDDLAKRARLYAEHGADVANWPDDVKKFHGEAPVHIEVPDLLAAGGGFQAKEGQELDPAKVEALKKDLD